MKNAVKLYGSIVSPLTAASAMSKTALMTAKSKKNGKKKKAIDMRSSGFSRPVDVSWLFTASNKYDISPDIRDYVVVPVPVITAAIPNRNCQAFPKESLLDFSTEYGVPRYASFVGKPTFEEHANDIMVNAKGVNLDATVVRIPKYNVFKIVVLSAFCRQKDPRLANLILSGKRNSYSMGAVATKFRCSICGGMLGPGVTRTCICRGTDYTQLGSLGRVIKGRLHYHSALDPIFIENSSVADPADISAVAPVL